MIKINNNTIPRHILKALCTYHWPGNVRELQNELQRYLAGQRLECDLAWRKAHARGAAGQQPSVPPTHRAAETVEPAAPEVGLSLSEPAAPEDAEPARQNEARSFARLVATDIRLYNEESVQMGRSRADLIDRLGDQLRRGKETFVRRHGQLGPVGLDLLYEAYVQVLAGGDEKLLPRSVFD